MAVDTLAPPPPPTDSDTAAAAACAGPEDAFDRKIVRRGDLAVVHQADARGRWRRRRSCSSSTSAASGRRSCSSATPVTTPPPTTCSTSLVVIFVWFVVLFGNFAEALAEGRGKAQADSLRKTRSETVAHVLQADGSTVDMPSTKLQVGDRCVVDAGELIPGDGDVVEGMALVDESAITGESAPVIRESGGDRSSVTGGTRVLSDRIVVQITTAPGESFIDRMIALVEGADRQKTPNEIALQILLVALTHDLRDGGRQPCSPSPCTRAPTRASSCWWRCWSRLVPTTIGALLSAIGIAGMDRMVQHNVLAMSGRAVEALG